MSTNSENAWPLRFSGGHHATSGHCPPDLAAGILSEVQAKQRSLLIRRAEVRRASQLERAPRGLSAAKSQRRYKDKTIFK